MPLLRSAERPAGTPSDSLRNLIGDDSHQYPVNGEESPFPYLPAWTG
jgi:hypothetical protein